MKRALSILVGLILVAGTCPALNPFFEVIPFQIKNLPGLVLWLDASDASTITLSGSNITQVNDKSGHGNNVVQATMASQPTYSATGLNGHPAIMFNGGQQLVNTGFTVPRPFSIYIIAEGVGSSSYPGVLFAGGASVYTGLSSQVAFAAGGVYPTYTDLWTSPHCYAWNISASALALYADGALVQTDAGDPYDGAPGVVLGSAAGGPWTGPVGEIIITSSVLTAAQIAQLHTYAHRKWGTP